MKRVWGLLVAVVWLASAAVAQVGQQGALLVVTKQTHGLAIVDAASLKVVGTVPVGEDPHEVVVGPDGRTAYVSNYGDARLHTIAVVDLAGQRALPAIDIAPLRGAHGLWVHDGMLWFTAEGSKALGWLDTVTRQVSGVLGTGQEKTHLVWVSKDGSRVVASNAGSGTMSVFRGAERAGGGRELTQVLVPVGPAAEGFAVSPDEREIWVGDDDGVIWLIDLETAKVKAQFDAGARGANRLKFTPDGRLVLMTTHRGKELTVLDARTRMVVKRIPIEQGGASGIEVQPDGRRAFVACPRDHYVAVVDLERLEMVGKIDAGREPDGLAWWKGATVGR